MLGLVPLQLPVHPVKVYPEAGVATSPSAIDAGIVTEHADPAVPQFRPAPITVPPVGRALIVML